MSTWRSAGVGRRDVWAAGGGRCGGGTGPGWGRGRPGPGGGAACHGGCWMTGPAVRRADLVVRRPGRQGPEGRA
ncbi:hypothetical protein AB0I39_36575 [Kitasatospora purpeofusca]|uniref:hypothetical protein n=1 Tax=Kitasatospora purpeofusca TaxID=67352 RepID=UPI0033E16DE5